MQIISWNCRGLGNPNKAEAVKVLLRMEPTNILLLQETKIEEDALLLLSKSKWKKNSGMVASARGTSGGLATLWSEEDFLLKALYAYHTRSIQIFSISQVRLPWLSSTFMSL